MPAILVMSLDCRDQFFVAEHYPLEMYDLPRTKTLRGVEFLWLPS